MKNIILTILVIAVIVLSPFSAYAADPVYRLMHNDHDALIIGEVSSVENNFCAIAVSDTVINVKGWDLPQIRPEIVLIPLDTFYYIGFDDKLPQVGDYLLASVYQKNKSKNIFDIIHGAYCVDALDKSNLSIIIPNDATDGLKMDAAMIKCFINSDGEYSEYSIDGIEARLDLDDGSHISIYPVYPSGETFAEIGFPKDNAVAPANKDNSTLTHESESYAEHKTVVPVQKETIYPVSIIIISILVMVIIVICIRTKKRLKG